MDLLHLTASGAGPLAKAAAPGRRSRKGGQEAGGQDAAGRSLARLVADGVRCLRAAGGAGRGRAAVPPADALRLVRDIADAAKGVRQAMNVAALALSVLALRAAVEIAAMVLRPAIVCAAAAAALWLLQLRMRG